ncbi:5060_t:CDS:10 [Funneliformis geosporum]|uniref:3576_t:CDS:1 n=1 Tax=Funneliformis geosporum TaxID=1117311 RepID=A0A9W4SBB7_9GLOM|nr:5060_t:CDS:10 [Funneliformis geosporum]CAI2162715.1 3576_t:CDS:10 [Funneliformis geosporum]
MTARQAFRFCFQTPPVFKDLFNSTLVTPFFLKRVNLLKNNHLVDKNSVIRYFTTTSTKKAENSDDSNDSNKISSKASSLVQSFLHGSQAIREEEKQTHSKLIARGKYVHELQKHKIKPECVEDYIKLVSEHYPRIANDPENSVHLCGSWQTEIGNLDTFVHIWEYQGYIGYDETRNRLKKDHLYQKFIKELRPMLQSRYNQVCLEFAFWKTSPPAVNGGIYELRTYELKPGNLLEWETHWVRGLECRKQFCEPVGAWFCQLGALNFVHHMWQYPDLENRKITREQAWQVDGWAETVYKTVRLVRKMETNILTPLSFSPLR